MLNVRIAVLIFLVMEPVLTVITGKGYKMPRFHVEWIHPELTEEEEDFLLEEALERSRNKNKTQEEEE